MDASLRESKRSPMNHQLNRKALLGQSGAAALALFLMLAAGCKNQAPVRTDQQVTADVQGKISGEGALNGQDIQVTVVNGVATLSGTVTDEASRALAGNDSGTVEGVRTVVNNLTVQAGRRSPALGTAAPRPAPAPKESGKRHRQEHHPDRPQEAQAVQSVAPPQPV